MHIDYQTHHSLFFFFFFFFVIDQDMEVKIKICNSAVCTTTDSIHIRICEQNDEERENSIENTFENVCFFNLF